VHGSLPLFTKITPLNPGGLQQTLLFSTPTHPKFFLTMEWYNKPLAPVTLVAVPPGGKTAELDPNPKLLTME
jgi:hypothetical protein